jgi:hypothetical protein
LTDDWFYYRQGKVDKLIKFVLRKTSLPIPLSPACGGTFDISWRGVHPALRPETQCRRKGIHPEGEQKGERSFVQDSNGESKITNLYFQAIFDSLNFDKQAINMKTPQVMKERYKDRSFNLRPTISKLMRSTKMRNATNMLTTNLSLNFVLKT